MGCGATKHAAELPTPAPGSVDLGGSTTTPHAQEPLPASPDKNPVTDTAAEAQAADIVKGTSTEVKAAAEAEAARAGEDWAQLSWQRRQKLCASAAATVLQAKIDAGPQHTQTLCRNLRALEPVAAAATTSASSPPFPKLGLGRKEVLGAHHPNTLTSIGNMVDLLREMGRLAEAEVVLGNAVAVARETLGDDHLITLVLTAKAARLQHAQPGGAAAGKELLAATVARMVEVLGEGHQQTNKYREALRADGVIWACGLPDGLGARSSVRVLGSGVQLEQRPRRLVASFRVSCIL